MPTRGLCTVRYCASVCCYAPCAYGVRAGTKAGGKPTVDEVGTFWCYAIPGTDMAYGGGV
eukprot:3719892-Rhodomonas_salina.1